MECVKLDLCLDETKKKVEIAKLVIEQVRKEVGENIDEEPIYICDLGDIVEKLSIWKTKFDHIGCYYAVKCNPDTNLLKAMADMGVNFDCASKNEIQMILGQGVDVSRIIYSNPQKYMSDLKYARERGVSSLVFDSREELEKINKVYKGADGNLKLLMRIHANDESAFVPLGKKYGVHEHEYESLLQHASDLRFKVTGVAFHCGSGCIDVEAYKRAIKITSEVFDKAKRYGFNLNVIDIGGGFCGLPTCGVPIEIAIETVQEAIKEYFTAEQLKMLKIIAEPGRFLAQTAFSLLTCVIGKRMLTNNEKSCYYYLNDGVYCSFLSTKFGIKHSLPTVIKQSKPTNTFAYCCILWGPTLDSIDKIIEINEFPELDIGDFLLWKNFGAYTVALRTHFNGYGSVKVKYVIKQKWRNVSKNIRISNVTL